jgi:hypothetical protein
LQLIALHVQFPDRMHRLPSCYLHNVAELMDTTTRDHS